MECATRDPPSRRSLATVLWDQGEYKEAEEIHRQALGLREPLGSMAAQSTSLPATSAVAISAQTQAGVKEKKPCVACKKPGRPLYELQDGGILRGRTPKAGLA